MSGASHRAYVFVGPPACGKGTQCRVLAQLPGFLHLSMGQVLRGYRTADVDEARELDEARRLILGGHLAPDEFTLRLFDRQLARLEASGIYHPGKDTLLLDGVPRTEGQAYALMERMTLLGVFEFLCPEALVHERIGRRRLQEGRSDDVAPETVQNRLRIFNETLSPLLKALRRCHVVQVDAARPAHHVLRDILEHIE